MTFVARLAIALATLISSAWLCWGQQPIPTSGGGPSAFAPRPAADREPSRTPPVELTGTWVSDDGEDAMAPVQPPEQIGAEPFAIDQSMATGDCGCEACGGQGCDNCDGGYCDPNGGAGGGHGCGLFGPLWCSDMWNEVHAHRRIYAEVDYLSFWTKGNSLPPLVTTSPLGTPQSQTGVLPESATTQILFGNGNYDDERRNGARINLGYWLIDGEFLGVEGQYWALNTAGTTFNGISNFSSDPGATILARPFTNFDPNLVEPINDAAIVAFPDGYEIAPGATGTLNGSINIQTTSNVQSAGSLLRKLVWIDFTMQRRLDLLLGYRFLRIDDSVTINDSSTFMPTSGAIPELTIASQDQFSARNIFNGGEIGVKYQSQHGRLGIEGIAKCAFGNNQQKTYINGYNSITPVGGAPTDNVGGLLAQPSNIGTYERNVFAIVPEADLSLKWDITCNLRATVGYTFVYINRVQRSGDAIDLDLNPTQINGGTLIGDSVPAFTSTDTTWYAHGATAGMEFRW